MLVTPCRITRKSCEFLEIRESLEPVMRTTGFRKTYMIRCLHPCRLKKAMDFGDAKKYHDDGSEEGRQRSEKAT